ncbi:hypothetical protein [Synechococcus sp. RedBA-s]|uniref:hypothetical protein n=1 Tax=Synechococcus sp. RedBA-s TaxID=2823741 RepID=UPI0020CB6AD3|nr:hypothetical protein [Synechococcus sp. RedBA-s]MCP9800780.1 hypothetical protein [Synechococcus sp. RedBA-s]
MRSALLAFTIGFGSIFAASSPSFAQQSIPQIQLIPGKQCVYNKSGYSATVSWYNPGTVIFTGESRTEEKDYTKYSIVKGAKPAEAKTITVGFSSCTQYANRIAVVRIVGYDKVNSLITNLTGAAVGIGTAVGGAFVCAASLGAGCIALTAIGPAAGGAIALVGDALPEVKEIAYIGSPGTKNYLDLGGTVWDPSASIATSLPLGNGRCPDGKVNDAGLCYVPCKAGFKGVATMCVPSCPSGFTDTGLHCAKPAAYGRGAGFPWQFGDKAFSLDGARQRCAAANPQGCEVSGAIVYPKCRSGFNPIGSNICTPQCPSGMLDIGVSCQKQTYDRGAGTVIQ